LGTYLYYSRCGRRSDRLRFHPASASRLEVAAPTREHRRWPCASLSSLTRLGHHSTTKKSIEILRENRTAERGGLEILRKEATVNKRERFSHY
jgi:hypothetical protein